MRFDEIGAWSEIKLEVIRKYASAYSTIFSARSQHHFHHIYIDAFAGPGFHRSRSTGGFVAGSPMHALRVVPPFREYHFIDLESNKVEALRELAAGRDDVHIYQGDCNEILLEEILPAVRFADYKRALCLLDPYGLHLRWEVMRTAGTLRTVDMLLNFPVADMNRNILWRNPEGVDPADIARMNAFWGDESWRQVAYRPQPTLFGEIEQEKTDNATIAEAFRHRLRDAGGFGLVPPPLAMRNSNGAIVYYLFFASQNATAERIIRDIFRGHGGRG